jgi:two-component system, chemotaxis family, CheB/CheR fusion protein
MRILPYRNTHNAIDGAVLTFVDVTALRGAEEHLRTLVEELNHRVRNMLTTVSAMASQTLKRSESGEEFRKVFLGRIQSMAAAYNLVSRESWHAVSLRGIAEAQFEPYAGEHGRLSIEGEEISLKPSAALAFGMIVHELTTNSVKYGALSKPSGKIELSWAANGKKSLIIKWTELDGPAVKIPSRKGLGSELIEREAKQALQGTVKLNYRETGLEAVFVVPLDTLTESGAP